MKFRVLALLITLSFLGLQSAPALAGGGLIQISGAPIYTKTDKFTGDGALGGSSSGEVNAASGLGYDARLSLGYVFNSRFLLGGTYNMMRAPLKADPVLNSPTGIGLDNYTKSSDYGPTLGLLWNNFHLMGTYLLGGKRTYQSRSIKNDGSGDFQEDILYEQKSGSGFQVDVGYAAPLSNWFSLGVSLVYKTVSYKKGSKTNARNNAENYSDVTFTSKPIEAALTPLLAMIFKF